MGFEKDIEIAMFLDCGLSSSSSAASLKLADFGVAFKIMASGSEALSAVVLRKAKDEHLRTFSPLMLQCGFGGCCQLCAWLRRFARCSLRERDSWSLSGSPRLVFSAQLCRFGRVDVIWLCRFSVVFLAWIVNYMVLMFSNQDKRLVGF